MVIRNLVLVSPASLPDPPAAGGNSCQHENHECAMSPTFHCF